MSSCQIGGRSSIESKSWSWPHPRSFLHHLLPYLIIESLIVLKRFTTTSTINLEIIKNSLLRTILHFLRPSLELCHYVTEAHRRQYKASTMPRKRRQILPTQTRTIVQAILRHFHLDSPDKHVKSEPLPQWGLPNQSR